MIEDNQLGKSFHLLNWVVVVLLLLSFIPEFSIGRYYFKKVNLLADLQADTPRSIVKQDSTKQKISLLPIQKDTCKPGVTCIEDYSDDKNALGNFFKALAESRHRAVKVAFFGDSFTEADILCGSFRDTLQQLFGGHGVGYMPITSQVNLFRPTIQHSFSGWRTFWIVGDNNPHSPPGFSGYCFVPQEGNEVEYKPGKRRYGKFHSVKIFYKSKLSTALHYTLDDSVSFVQPLVTSDTVQQEAFLCKGAQTIKLHFEPFDSLKLYGVSFEESTGLYVDNFSMRGNSGIGLFQIEPSQLQQFNRFQHYKLILLQYVLNVVTENDSTGYDWYVDKMVRVISRLKENLPGSNFLLISVSDRSYNQNGKFVTMPNIILMRDAQRQIAKKSKIAFWNLLSAMSGENSIAKMVTATPPLAAKDYTHVNFAGGRRLSKKLADALLYERVRYDEKGKKLP